MKNRKIVVVAFMLVAVLMLGVGYAALTDTLTIIGNAHIDIAQAETTFDNNIYFSASTATSSTGTGSVSDTVNHTADDATFTANKLAVKGEKSVFTFTITNDSNVPAVISVAPTKLSGAVNPSNSNEGIFKVTYAYSEPDMTIDALGGTMDVTVTVEVVNPVTSATSATFGIELTATTAAS